MLCLFHWMCWNITKTCISLHVWGYVHERLRRWRAGLGEDSMCIGLHGEKRVWECVLVRIIALFCFARFTTFHNIFLDAGSNPVLGSSIYTTFKNIQELSLPKCYRGLISEWQTRREGQVCTHTLGSPISEIATLSLLFIPPLYFPACLSATPPWNRFTLLRDSSTAYIIIEKSIALWYW